VVGYSERYMVNKSLELPVLSRITIMVLQELKLLCLQSGDSKFTESFRLQR